MSTLREELHELIDQLPSDSLQQARAALLYCANSEKQRATVEKAMQRARDNFQRHLRRHVEKTGQGLLGTFVSGGRTFPDGKYHGSTIAFEDGKDATCHLYIFRGTMFEIIETLEISEDGGRVIRRERIKAADGVEQTLTAELPVTEINDASER